MAPEIRFPTAQFPFNRTMTSTDDDCPFCAIVKTYPHPALDITSQDSDNVAYIVLSTPHILAFLDRLPLTKCHTIIIPRAHFELLSDIPSTYAAELGRVLPVVSRAVVEVSGADGFNVVQNNGTSRDRCGLMGRGECWPGYSAFAFSCDSSG